METLSLIKPCDTNAARVCGTLFDLKKLDFCNIWTLHSEIVKAAAYHEVICIHYEATDKSMTDWNQTQAVAI